VLTNITQRGRLDKLSPKRALKGAILAHYREEETGRWKPGWTLKIEQCRYGMQIVFCKVKGKKHNIPYGNNESVNSDISKQKYQAL
jgi:hypothetical protein